MNATDNEDDTPLLLACKKGMLEMATMLKDAGAAINVANKGGDTPLLAARRRQPGVVKLHVSAGAYVGAKNKVERLIAAGAHGVIIINTEDDLFEAPAADVGYSAAIPVLMIKAKDAAALLASGNSSCLVWGIARNTARNTQGQTLLMRASALGLTSTVAKLLALGADIAAKDKVRGNVLSHNKKNYFILFCFMSFIILYTHT